MKNLNQIQPWAQIKINAKEVRWARTLQPFKMDSKFEIESYGGKVDVDKLDKWFKHLEVYFEAHGYED